MCARDLNLSDLREAPTTTQRSRQAAIGRMTLLLAPLSPNIPATKFQWAGIDQKINSIGAVST
jgi:hypothetical protein